MTRLRIVYRSKYLRFFFSIWHLFAHLKPIFGVYSTDSPIFLYLCVNQVKVGGRGIICEEICCWLCYYLLIFYIFHLFFRQVPLIPASEVALLVRKKRILHRKCKIWKTKNIVLILGHVRFELCSWKCKNHLFVASLVFYSTATIFSKASENVPLLDKMISCRQKKPYRFCYLGRLVSIKDVDVHLVQQRS